MAVPVFVSGPQDKNPVPEEKPIHNFYNLLDRLGAEFSKERMAMIYRLGISAAALLVYGIYRALRYSGYFPVADENLEVVLGVALSIVALCVSLFCLSVRCQKAWRSLLAGRLDIEICLMLALLLPVLALCYDLLFLHDHIGQQGMAGTLLTISFFVSAERFGSGWFLRRFGQLGGFRLDKLAPQVKLLDSDGPATDAGSSRSFITGQRDRIVEALEIKAGDVFRLERGDIVPCDARVLDGLARLDERRFSGRWQVRFKGKGAEIYGGSQLASGSVTCKALSTANDSSITWFSKILDRSINQALPSDTELRFSLNLACLSVLFVAALAAVIWLGQGAGVLMTSALVSGILLLAVFSQVYLLLRLAPVLALSRLFLRGVLARSLKAFSDLAQMETFVLDTPEASGGYRMKAVLGLDDRIDEQRLGSVLLSLFAASEEQPFMVLAEELLTKFANPEPFEVFDFVSCAPYGVCGKISGVEFSAGVEEFLVERGVYVESSDLETPGAGEQVIYLAMGAEIIARLKYAASQLEGYRLLISSLERRRKRVMVCSQQDSEQLRSNIRELGLGSSGSHIGLSVDAYRDRLKSVSPVALLIPDPATRDIEPAATIAISVFDEMRWNVEKSDLLLFSPDVSLVSEALEESLACGLRQKVFTGCAGGFALVLALLAGFGILPAGWVALLVVSGHLGLQAYLYFVSITGIPLLARG